MSKSNGYSLITCEMDEQKVKRRESIAERDCETGTKFAIWSLGDRFLKIRMTGGTNFVLEDQRFKLYLL